MNFTSMMKIYSGKNLFCQQKLFLPVRFFYYGKKTVFPPSGKNVPTLMLLLKGVRVSWGRHTYRCTYKWTDGQTSRPALLGRLRGLTWRSRPNNDAANDD